MPSYEADLSRFESYDTHVLGISVDSAPSNAAWAKSLGGISYDLLSDFEPKGEVARSYGVYHPFGLTAIHIARPATFLIDRQGIIRYARVARGMKDRDPLDRALEAIDALSQAPRTQTQHGI